MTANVKRTERTRRLLIRASRALFAQDGYAATSTPAITAEAGVSRGALYHHFGDKAGLFRAVIDAEQEQLARAIEEAPDVDDPIEAIIRAGEAFLDAMRDPGIRRLIYIEGPAVLGDDAMREIDSTHGARTLAEGLARGVDQGTFDDMPVNAVANLLSAAYDRAAAEGTLDHRVALRRLVEGLRARPDHTSGFD